MGSSRGGVKVGGPGRGSRSGEGQVFGIKVVDKVGVKVVGSRSVS